MSDVTSEQSIARFLEYATVEKGLAPLTIDAYRADLAQLSRFVGRCQLVNVRNRDVRDFIWRLLSDGIQARSVRRKVSTFREFFKFLLLDGLIRTDVMARIESPKVGRVLPKGVSEIDLATAFETLRDHCKGRHAERMRLRESAALELLYGSGLRVSELVDARVADVNLADRCIIVTGKGAKRRGAHLAIGPPMLCVSILPRALTRRPGSFPVARDGNSRDNESGRLCADGCRELAWMT